ncbi:hypothetical protein MRX96_001067 [Rhipicephalus microplus]
MARRLMRRDWFAPFHPNKPTNAGMVFSDGLSVIARRYWCALVGTPEQCVVFWCGPRPGVVADFLDEPVTEAAVPVDLHFALDAAMRDAYIAILCAHALQTFLPTIDIAAPEMFHGFQKCSVATLQRTPTQLVYGEGGR